MIMMMKKRRGMTIAELLISILIFSIFLIVLFSALNIVINAMETQDMIVSKLYTASKINFLFGILEDEFKWLGSFGKGVSTLGGAFDVSNSKGFEVKPTPGSSDVIFDYQYAVIENFVLQKQEDDVYEVVFPNATATVVGGEYFVILSDEQMNTAATATINSMSDFSPGATDATVTITPSHDATRIYFVRIRGDNFDTKPTDENGNPDNLEQLVRGNFFYNHEKSTIYLNTRKGFSAFNSTMTVLDDVEAFEMNFYDSSISTWTTTPSDYGDVSAIKTIITVSIPVSESIKRRCVDNPEMIQLTKSRVFWLPPDEDL